MVLGSVQRAALFAGGICRTSMCYGLSDWTRCGCGHLQSRDPPEDVKYASAGQTKRPGFPGRLL